MRLSKPALYHNVPIYAEEETSSSVNAFLAGQARDIGIGDDHSVLSNLLVLPYSFGLVRLSIDSLHGPFFPSSILEMFFWAKSSRLLFHCIIRVNKHFEMLFSE